MQDNDKVEERWSAMLRTIFKIELRKRGFTNEQAADIAQARIASHSLVPSDTQPEQASNAAQVAFREGTDL